MAAPALARATAPNHTPNDALRRDAGALAAAVARVFARPHAPYFAADPARRRTIALLAIQKRLGVDDAEALAAWSMRRLFAHYAQDAPDGFIEALKKAEGVWGMAEYAILDALLQEGGEGAKTLRHCAQIDPRALHVLAALPSGLRRIKIVTLVRTPPLADLLARTVRHRWGRAPEAPAMRVLAQRLERASSTQGMFAWLVDEVGVGRITPPAIPGTDWLRPILSVRDIERTALKFQNCLRTRTPMMLRGQAAYFEVVGDEPAVVEVVTGKAQMWMVGEIRGHANEAISAGLTAKILAHLKAHGAQSRGGPSVLALALAEAAGW